MHYTPIKALERAMHREKDTQRERKRERENEKEKQIEWRIWMSLLGFFDPGNFRMSGVVLPFSLRSSC